MQIENKKSDVNNFIGIKTKEDFNYPLTFIILGILTKNYFKYNCYSEFTHRDIANKVNDLFELYKLREYEVIKFIPLNKKDTYSIKATDRANELLLYIHNLFLEGHFNNEFKNNFYKSKIRYKNNDTRIEINFTNINGVLNA